MKNNKTSILLILDRSGSMQSMHSDLVGGVNSFIEEQKAIPSECEISVLSFDDVAEEVLWNIPINFTPKFDIKKDFIPRGMTALFDAVGFGIDKLGEKLNLLPEEEKPSKVIVLIYTDGQENSSKKVKQTDLAEKIQHQQDKYSWTFIFMGANQDAVLTASQLNISSNQSLTYNSSSVGNFYAFSGASIVASGFRTVGTGSFCATTRNLASQ